MKLTKQENRVLKSLLQGSIITWAWGSQQTPWIADAPRVCRKLIGKDYPVKKETVKTGKSSYMNYYLPISYRAKVKDMLNVNGTPI